MLGLMSSALKSSTMLPSALRCKAVLRSAPRLPLRAFHVTAAQAAEDVPVVSQGAFIKKLASEIKVTEKESREIMSKVLSLIEDEVSAGNKVTFTGFGAFSPRHRAARRARNPRTQEMLEVPPAVVPAFSAGKTFKDKVKANGKV